ncbi:MAG: septum formation initiator family protein [Tannerella sp.]|jgi:cell division protein FtsB|nr:septum formation initiator family protein [Tannerella sp.]
MSRLKYIYENYLSRLNKYVVVFIAFVLVAFVFGDSNLYHHYVYDGKIHDLETEISQYKKDIEVIKQKLNVRYDKNQLERYAREEFFMKKSDEDLFIIVDK